MSVECPNCKANNPSNSVFCAECGTDLRPLQTSAPQSGSNPSQPSSNPGSTVQTPYNYGSQPQNPSNPVSPSQPTYVYGGQSQTPNNPPSPPLPGYGYSNQPQQPSNPSQPPNVYGGQPQSPSFNSGPAQPPYGGYGNQQSPSINPANPAQPPYGGYGNQQSPSINPVNPSQPYGGYGNPQQPPNNFVSPSLGYGNPQQPPNNTPYTPPNNTPYIPPNSALGRPNVGLNVYPQPTPYATQSTTSGRRGPNPFLIIGAVVLVLAVVVGGVVLATQGKTDTKGTATPSSQALQVSPTAAGATQAPSTAANATKAPSTVDLLNPGLATTAPATAAPATTAPATTAPATSAPATKKPTATRAAAPTATVKVDYTTVRGPEAFQLDHIVGKPTVKGFNQVLNVSDFYAGANFTNPYDATTAGAGWDYGFVFRDSSGGDAFIFVVTSSSEWELDRLDSKTKDYVTVDSGKLDNLKTGDGDANTVEILAQGSKLAVAVNAKNLDNTIDLSSFSGSGDVEVITGFFKGNKLDGSTTDVADFTVQVKK